jgi:hypothetical protein
MFRDSTRALILGASVLVLFSGHSQEGLGQTASVRSSVDLALGTCYQSMGDIERVKAMARSLNWKNLPPDMAKAMSPSDGRGYESWVVSDNGRPLFVAVNLGDLNGRVAHVCSVTINENPSEISRYLLSKLKTKRLKQESEGGQIYEAYQVEHNGRNDGMLTITKLDDGNGPLTIGFMSVK